MIIAIDGPSGAGKSTLGRMLARELGLLYLDTGAMYRAVAYAALRSGADTTDGEAMAKVARQANIELAGDPDSLQVLLDGHDISKEIRSEAAGHSASIISAIPKVRRELVRRQRELGARGGVVLDGRDIGTVVFPDADAKFFLTATPEQRAGRRYDEERRRAPDLNYEEILHDINARDNRDSSRTDSPLAIADNAVVFDTTELSIEEVFGRMLEVVRGKIASREHLHSSEVS